MTLQAYILTNQGAARLDTLAATLDELTLELPQGFYTTFSTLSHATKVLGLRAHLRRLFVPALQLGLKPSVDEEALREDIAFITHKNLPRESRVRVILTRESGTIYMGVQYFDALPAILYSRGVHAISTEMARDDPRVKSTAFIAASSNQRKQIRGSVFEVLLTKNGRILEGMTSNFFGIHRKTLITARRGILLGVTRSSILRLARSQGLSIDYRSPRLDEKLDEALLTSSSRGVVPIVSIDEVAVGEGSVGRWTSRLITAYRGYVEALSEKII